MKLLLSGNFLIELLKIYKSTNLIEDYKRFKIIRTSFKSSKADAYMRFIKITESSIKQNPNRFSTYM